jgi:hypothetical protein
MLLQQPYRLLTAFALCALLVGLTGAAEAKEFKSTAQELAEGKGAVGMGGIEILIPNAVVIDQKEDLTEPLMFVLENPTGFDHEFSVGELFMYATQEAVPSLLEMDPITRQVLENNMMVPIRITVEAGETKKILVAPIGIAVERSHRASYRFFCPKHKDMRVSGFIFVD